jgi:hypothetical protein
MSTAGIGAVVVTGRIAGIEALQTGAGDSYKGVPAAPRPVANDRQGQSRGGDNRQGDDRQGDGRGNARLWPAHGWTEARDAFQARQVDRIPCGWIGVKKS